MVGVSPQCYLCRHLHPLEPGIGWTCEAYPRRIPKQILVNAADHRRPYAGDRGVRFEMRIGIGEDEWREDDHPRDAGGKFSRTGSGGISGESKHLDLEIGGQPFTVEMVAGRPVSVTEHQNVGGSQREAKLLWRKGELPKSSYYERAIEYARREHPEEFAPPAIPEIDSHNIGGMSIADIAEAKRELGEYQDHLFEKNEYDPEKLMEIQAKRDLLKSEVNRREENLKQAAVEARRAEPRGRPEEVIGASHEWGTVRGGFGYNGPKEEIEPLWQQAAHGTQHLLDAAREAGYSDRTIRSVFSALRGQGHGGKSEKGEKDEVARIAEGEMGHAEQSLLRAIGEHQASAEGVADHEYYRKGTFSDQPVISTTTNEAGAAMAVGPGKFRRIGWDQKRSGADLLRQGYLPFGTTYTQGYQEEDEVLWVKFPKKGAQDAMPKKSKAQVDYTDHARSSTEQCQHCRHFEAPHSCEGVAGTISPGGWCRMWQVKAAHDRGMATDPPVSEAQRRAMWAAAAGHSNIGIPKKVGREFAEADPGGKLPETARDMTRPGWRKVFEGLSEIARFFREEEREPEHQGEDAEPEGRAASVMFVTPDGRVLLVRRSAHEENYPGHWALPGGRADGEETYEQAARREVAEELGDCGLDQMREFDRVRTSRGFDHATFAAPVEEPFDPELNDEHDCYGWYPIDELPEPIHPGVARSLRESYDCIPAVEQQRGAHDEIGPWPYSMAADKAVRTRDDSGRLHVTDSVLSKAVVSPYLGREINEVMKDEPGWEMLEPDRKYHLLRDPKELAKAKDTFNGLPLLWTHRATSAQDHPHEIVIGSTGSNAQFRDGENLTNDLVVWPDYATRAVEDGERKSLSCGYGYRAVMEPGTHRGQRYDGRMVDIRGNHVALVDQPRVPGAEVGGDSADELLWRELASAIRSLAA